VTYTGYTLLQNMLKHDNPNSIPKPPVTATKPSGNPSSTTPAGCIRRRDFSARVKLPRGARVKTLRAKLAGKKVKLRRKGRTVTVRIRVRSLKGTRVALRVEGRKRGARKRFVIRRSYKLCT
jgi:hypothetical protein